MCSISHARMWCCCTIWSLSQRRLFLENLYISCENGSDTSWKTIAEMIGQGLHKAGKLDDPEPRTILEDMYGGSVRQLHNGTDMLKWSESRGEIKECTGYVPNV